MKKIKFFIFIFLLSLSSLMFAQSFTQVNVTITANVTAQVYLNGQYRGNTPLTLTLQVGRYSLKLVANGYQTLETSIEVKQTGSNTFNFNLIPISQPVQTPQPQPQQTGYGTLIVTADYPSYVYINNVRYGETPFNKSVAAGTYTLVVEPKDKKYPAQTRTITIIANQTTSVTIQFVVAQKYSITIETNVSCEVYINGQIVGNTPININLEEGTYNLRLVPRVSGYQEMTTTINVNSNNRFYFTLQQSTFNIGISTNVQCDVYINGRLVGTSPLNISLTSGTYSLRLVPKVAGYQELNTSFTVTQNNNFVFTLEAIKVAIKINLPPSAQLYINGEKINWNAKDNIIYLAPGKYKIKITYHDFVIEKEITIEMGKSISISLIMDMVISY
ncbi:MAG: PEGA domain-containing protein [Spirochaetes bacterium]|nr:PEGA domain-containing protein [Spirochaetota bacterium]